MTPHKRPWTTTERREVAAHLAQRRPHAEIAQAFNRSVAAIKSVSARLGRTTKRSAWSPHELFLLRRLYTQGNTATQIAAALKRSAPSVRGMIQRMRGAWGVAT